MTLNPKRTVAELKELRALTGDENGAQRVAWTDTWREARAWFASLLTDLPVEHHYDSAGNNWATLQGDSPKSLLIGGHLDSVPNGGWLDGSLNVLAGLEVLRRISTEFNGKPPITIRLVDDGKELVADVPHFTNSMPTIQFGHSAKLTPARPPPAKLDCRNELVPSTVPVGSVEVTLGCCHAPPRKAPA